jgi:hypothetical protein
MTRQCKGLADQLVAWVQPGTTGFGYWLEYNGEAADNATHRLR